MEGTPEQGLRAWVDYLRDMGVYDLYRHPAPSIVLPDEVRERVQAAAASRAENLARNPIGNRPAVGLVISPPIAPAQDLLKARPASPTRPGTGATAAAKGMLAPSAGVPHLPASKTAASKSVTNVSEPAPIYFNAFSAEADAPASLPPELAAPMPKPQPLEARFDPPPSAVPAADRAAALKGLQELIGDCTRCPLAYAGRHTIVFGEGDPNAKLMFVGEGPGADEDESGRPFVGKAGQLLNNMISAMGLAREAVFIANIVKCRPPGNRTPEFAEATTCSQFLLGQIDIVRPQVIVALGSTAATYVLGSKQSLASLRGQWFSCRGAKVAVTYHPAFLLRDPRQKGEAWKDLQRVMGELGLTAAARKG